jgi:hypothetical protein
MATQISSDLLSTTISANSAASLLQQNQVSLVVDVSVLFSASIILVSS